MSTSLRTIERERAKYTSSTSRRWQITSFAAQFFGSGRRESTASLWPRIAAASSSGVRLIRSSRFSNGCFAYSSIVAIVRPPDAAALRGRALRAPFQRTLEVNPSAEVADQDLVEA